MQSRAPGIWQFLPLACFLGHVVLPAALCFSDMTWIPSTACPQLQHTLRLDNATILSTSHLPAGINISISDSAASCENPFYTTEAAICRVQVNATTSPSSSILVEAWLPDEWYGRYLGTGNGGLNGCVKWIDLVQGTLLHFATVGTNAGHKGDTGVPFLGHPEVLKDYVYRDIEVESNIGKAITAAYYNNHPQAPGKSYYTGCSAGGRTGFVAVQRYPDMFDGVVAGAPAINWNHIQAIKAKVGVWMQLTAAGTPALLDTAELDLVTKDVLEVCDGIDGVMDGIIDDPDMCIYRPERLLCGDKGAGDALCLSSEKVEAVRGIFEPLYGSQGQLLSPRFDPGFTGSSRALFGPELFKYPLDWWRYAIYNDSSFSTANFSLHDVEVADAIDPSGMSTYNVNIQPFVNHGGKIITFHGTQDELIPSGNTRRYYNTVSRVFNLPTLDAFFRHFQIPGMGHCGNGPGAWQIGQSGSVMTGLKNDSGHSVLLAMVEWVEGGKAPDVVVGTKFVNDTPALGVKNQKTHCAYPRKSVRSWWGGSECR